MRLGSESEGGWTDKKEEKIPHMCESIGHQPLQGRSPFNFNHNLLKQGTGTADHLMLLRLFNVGLPIGYNGIGRVRPESLRES